ncbi:retrovirus-related pol polyprotein from transposon TNT 1-94 [Tanacetum coccineum]
MLTKPQDFYDDTHKQALGYQNPFYLKKAQRIKPMLYDGIVISKKHDVISMVDEEETLILEEESRSKMLAKQNDPISKEKKINISPINYSELNKLSEDFGKRFVPQMQMSAEQAFWLPLSNPKSEQLNVTQTPVEIEVRKELPKVSLVNTSFQKLKNHLARFDKVVKVRTTPYVITKGSWDFENGLHSKLNEVKTVFNQMEAAVDRCFVDKKYFDIQKKELSLDNDRLLDHIICQDVMSIVMHDASVPVNVLPANNKCLVNDNLEIQRLEQENDHLFELLLSQDIVHICVNSLASRNDCREMQQGFIHEYNENLMLKAELAKKEHMVEKKFFDEVVLRCSRLENRGANLELKLQHQKESFLNNRSLNNQNAPEILEFFKINEWQAKLVAKDVSIANLRKHIETPKVLKNRDAHIDYIKHSQEHADTLWEIVEHARALRPIDRDLNSACMYVQRIQEVLVYVTNTCPSLTKPSEKLVAVTPLNKNKKVRFTQPATSSRMKSSTSASRLQPSDNTKNNRISRTTSSNPKNKVEDHPRSVKSNSNKKNRVSEPVCNANVKHTMFTPTKVVPLKETTSKSVTTPNLEIKIYRRKTKVAKSIDLSSQPSILGSMPSNISEPNKNWGSTVSNSPSSSLFNFRFGNDQIAQIMGYGDYQMGNVMISRVYYVEGLGHNLFSVGQFCDFDLETLSLEDMMLSSPICLLSKASKTKSWLWRRRLSHLNFDYITTLAKQGLIRGLPRLKFQKDHLCSACALWKSKKHSHKPKAKDSIQEKLYLLHMDLCGPMRIQSINGRKYILVIVDGYSRFTWEKFLRSKDEVPEFVIKFLKMIQVRLNATVRNIRTDNGTEFVNQTLRAYYEDVGIPHQTSVARTPQQNIIDLGKLKPKADIGIFVGYAPAKKAFRIYNKRTRLIIETIHVDFDELTTMASEQFSSGLGPQLLTPRTISSGLVVASPIPAVVAPVPANSTNSPSSTPVTQDAPSLSTSQTPQESQSLVDSPDVVEEFHDIEVAHLDNDPFFGVPIQEPNYEESSSRDVIPTNVHSVNQPP